MNTVFKIAMTDFREHCRLTALHDFKNAIKGLSNFDRTKVLLNYMADHSYDLYAFQQECKQFNKGRVKYAANKYPVFTQVMTDILKEYAHLELDFVDAACSDISRVLKEGISTSDTFDALVNNYSKRCSFALICCCQPEFYAFVQHNALSMHAFICELIKENKSSKKTAYIWLSILLDAKELLYDLFSLTYAIEFKGGTTK